MKSRNFSYGIIMAMAICLVTFLASKADAQPTFTAAVGSTFAINEYGTTGAAPVITSRLGYTMTPADATRLNIFGGYEIRQLRSTSIGTSNTFTVNDQKASLGAGIELGDKFRLGLNVGGLANFNKINAVGGNTRGQNLGGFTEGTISITKPDKKNSNASTTAGFSIRGEKSLKAPQYFQETQVGKNTGIVTTSFFMRRNFGKKSKKNDVIYKVPASAGGVEQFSDFRDKLLRDSIFGQAIGAAIGQSAVGAYTLAIDSSKNYTDLKVAQEHSKTLAEVNQKIGKLQKDVPSSYNSNQLSQPIGYRNVFPVFYDNGVSVLNTNQKLAIKNRVTGATTNTKFVISSFSSDIGGLSFNEGLTQGRATAIQQYLKSLGFNGPFEIRLFPSQGGNDGNRQSLIQW